MAVPVEIGTCGTVGSLLQKEIDYFRRLEVERVESCINVERNSEGLAPARRDSWRSLRFFMVPWGKKKRRKRGIKLPGICSIVDVEDNKGMNGIPGFSYRNLKEDSTRSGSESWY